MQNEPQLQDAADAIAIVVWGIQDLLESKDVASFAHNVSYLQNAVSDLSSWHPSYDFETGLIPREDEE